MSRRDERPPSRRRRAWRGGRQAVSSWSGNEAKQSKQAKEAKEAKKRNGRRQLQIESSGMRIKGAGGMGMQRIWLLAWPDRLPAMRRSVLGGGGALEEEVGANSWLGGCCRDDVGWRLDGDAQRQQGRFIRFPTHCPFRSLNLLSRFTQPAHSTACPEGR